MRSGWSFVTSIWMLATRPLPSLRKFEPTMEPSLIFINNKSFEVFRGHCYTMQSHGNLNITSAGLSLLTEATWWCRKLGKWLAVATSIERTWLGFPLGLSTVLNQSFSGIAPKIRSHVGFILCWVQCLVVNWACFVQSQTAVKHRGCSTAHHSCFEKL